MFSTQIKELFHPGSMSFLCFVKVDYQKKKKKKHAFAPGPVMLSNFRTLCCPQNPK